MGTQNDSPIARKGQKKDYFVLRRPDFSQFILGASMFDFNTEPFVFAKANTKGEIGIDLFHLSLSPQQPPL